MDFLGVGPTEVLLIIAIAIIVLGPKNMAETGRAIGSWLNRFVQSDLWKILKNTSQEIQRLPTQLMREDNLENFSNADPTQTEQGDAWRGTRSVPTPAAPPRPAEADAAPMTIATPAEPLTPPDAAAPPPQEAAAPKTSAKKKPASAKKSGKKLAAKPSRASRKKSNA